MRKAPRPETRRPRLNRLHQRQNRVLVFGGGCSGGDFRDFTAEPAATAVAAAG
jgi:hypothetical protein